MADAVEAAYAAAGLRPGGLDSAVAPLKALVDAHPLIVDEIAELTRQTAAAHMAMQIGRALIDAPDGIDPLAGFLYANASGGWIVVERGDPLVRRRFSIAHELGHYLLHFIADTDAEEFRDELRRPNGDDDPVGGHAAFRRGTDPLEVAPDELARMEREADLFAALVLMPEPTCRRLVESHSARSGGLRSVLARRLASELLVSQTAASRRLAELGLP